MEPELEPEPEAELQCTGWMRRGIADASELTREGAYFAIKHEHVQLNQSGDTATRVNTGGSNGVVALCSDWIMTDGKSYAEFEILKSNSRRTVGPVVGLACPRACVESSKLAGADFFILAGHTGKYIEAPAGTTMDTKHWISAGVKWEKRWSGFREGDTVGLLLDCDRGTLNVTHKKRGTNELYWLGAPTRSLPKHKPLCFFTGLRNKGDSVRIAKLPLPPQPPPKSTRKRDVRRFKYTLVGDAGVGKTALMRQVTRATFTEAYSSTKMPDFGTRGLSLGSEDIRLEIVDTPDFLRSEPLDASISRSYYRGAVGYILVYDVTQRETFQHLGGRRDAQDTPELTGSQPMASPGWLDNIRHDGDVNAVTVLVGNKIDLRTDEDHRCVSYAEGKKFADQNSLPYFETSAKTAENVLEAFQFAAESIYQRIQNGDIDVRSSVHGIQSTSMARESLHSEVKEMHTTSKGQVDWSGRGVDDQSIEELAVILETNRSIRRLDLSCNLLITDDGWNCLIRRGLRSSSVTEVAVHGCHISSERKKQIFKQCLQTMIKSVKRNDTDLVALRLKRSGIGDTDTLILAEALRNNSTIHLLDLTRNDGITDAAFGALKSGLEASEVKEIDLFGSKMNLENQTALQKIVLDRYLQSSGTDPDGRTELILYRKCLDDDMVATLAGVLQSKPEVRRLDVSVNTQVTDVGWSTLQAALESSNVEFIDFYKTSVGTRRKKEMFSICFKKTLKRVEENDPTLTNISLRRWGCADTENVWALASSLSKNWVVQDVDLSQNCMGANAAGEEIQPRLELAVSAPPLEDLFPHWRFGRHLSQSNVQRFDLSLCDVSQEVQNQVNLVCGRNCVFHQNALKHGITGAELLLAKQVRCSPDAINAGLAELVKTYGRQEFDQTGWSAALLSGAIKSITNSGKISILRQADHADHLRLALTMHAVRGDSVEEGLAHFVPAMIKGGVRTYELHKWNEDRLRRLLSEQKSKFTEIELMRFQEWMNPKPPEGDPSILSAHAKFAEFFEQMGGTNSLSGLQHVPVSTLPKALSFLRGASTMPSEAALEAATAKAYRKADAVLATWHSNRRLSAGHKPNSLTRDEIAAVNIYTQDHWHKLAPIPAGTPTSLFRPLNAALRSESREQVINYWGYVRLLQHALFKLPKDTSGCTLYRGIKLNQPGHPSLEEYQRKLRRNQNSGTPLIWWGFSSTSTSLEAVKGFLGKDGPGVIFVVDADSSARDVRDYSGYQDGAAVPEDERLLPCATAFEVISAEIMIEGLLMVSLRQTNDTKLEAATAIPEPEPQFEPEPEQ